MKEIFIKENEQFKNQEKLLLTEQFIVWIKEKFTEYKVPFLSSMIVGLLTCMFAFTNKLPNHDEVYNLFCKGAELDSGRWGLSLMSYVFPDFSMPWIYGIITIVLISISVCLIVNIFNIKNKIYKGLLGGLIIAFPSLIVTFNYMFTSTSYAVAILLSILAVYFLIKQKWYNKIIAVICIIFSLSIYQAYIAITASFLLILAVQMLIKDDSDIKLVIRKGIFFVLFLVVSLALYYGSTKFILLLLNQEFNSYSNNNLDVQYSILGRLFYVYYYFIIVITKNQFKLIPTRTSSILHIAILLIIAIEVIIWIFNNKDIRKILLFITLLCLFPMATNCMFLFVTESAIRSIVLYGFISIYVLMFVLLESINVKNNFRLKRLPKDIVSIFLFMVVIINVYFGNQVYLSMFFRYENTYSFYTSLISDIKTDKNFTRGTKIAIIGGNDIECCSNVDDICDKNGIEILGGLGLKPFSYKEFIKNYIGFDAEFATDEEMEQIAKTEEFKNMERYPYYGSIQKIDDYLVVKFSDLEKVE